MQYHAPTELSEALERLSGGGVTVLAGGTDHFPALQIGDCSGDLLDVTRINGLRGIDQHENGWRIGAATTWSDIAGAALPPAFAGLQAAAREVGARQIQNAGTLAGNIVNASPAADGVPPLLTLDAVVELQSRRGTRAVPLQRFITGVRRVDMAEDEIVVAVQIPPTPDNARSGFLKLGSRRYLVISIAMAAVLIVLDDDAKIAEARVSVGACSPVAARLPVLERELVGQSPTGVIVAADHLAPLSPIDDVRADATYRMNTAAELIRRAIAGVA